MIARTVELTLGCARPSFAKPLGRSFFQLAVVAAAALFLMAAVSSPSLAAPIFYGSFAGTTVTYTNVTEDANSFGDAPPLFGAPSVSGDSLDFNPVGFSANSAGGGSDITDGQLFFGVEAHADKAISSLTLSEAGDTTLAGIGTNNTFTSVTASGILNVYEVDGIGINVIASPFTLNFSPSGGTYGMLSDGGGGPFFHTAWSGSLLLNLNQILTTAGVAFDVGATKISINLDNTLVAVSQAGTSALIAKKDFGGLSITVNDPDPGGEPGIPEPTSAVLAGLGLLALSTGWRRGRIA